MRWKERKKERKKERQTPVHHVTWFVKIDHLEVNKVILVFAFVQEVNEIWYPGRSIIRLLRYQISVTSCTKWLNNKHLIKHRHGLKLIPRNDKYGHIYIMYT